VKNQEDMMQSRLCLVLFALFIAGCAAPGFPPQTAKETVKVPADRGIEVGLAPNTFEVAEVEFHVAKESIPVLITKRAKEEMPDGEIMDAEIEYHGGVLYYEVTAKVRGQEQEVMFTAGGKVHRWELAVSPDAVPPKIMERAMKALPDAKLKKCEQILDGSQDLIEYHFKMVKDNMKYKIVRPIDPMQRTVVYRETLAEIEVPIK
jgi:uncharacterized membrane protein YkoI